MTASRLAAARTVVGAGLPPRMRRGLQEVVRRQGDVAWSCCADLRDMVGAAAPVSAPDVLVVSLEPRRIWSLMVLLGELHHLDGGRRCRVLLVTEEPRAALPVHLTDGRCLEVVVPDRVEAVLHDLLRRPA